MANEFNELRQGIRKVLKENFTLPEKGIKEDTEGRSPQCSWVLFEEFGIRLLERIQYQGDYNAIDMVKEELKSEGWNYDEF